MRQLAFAAATFFALHRAVSGSPFRRVLARRLGEEPFRRLFAAASLLCLVWLTVGYRLAEMERPLSGIIGPPPPPWWLLWPLQIVGLLLVVAGIGARNPTTTGMQDAVREDVVRGVLRITRHPFLWGVSLIAIGHMLARTDAPSCVYFGTLLLLALSGTVSIDMKRRRTLAGEWEEFAARTSNLPFAAVALGRQRVRWREIGWRMPAVSTGAFTAVMLVHWFLWEVWT